MLEKPFHPSWSVEAAAVLQKALDYYGGWQTWASLQHIRFVPTELRGTLMWIKGVGRTFPLMESIEVFPHECRTVFHGYPDKEHRGVFQKGDVWIESVATGTVVKKGVDHRKSFRGWAKNRRWTPLDALYFFGYALWHYHAVPFTLGEARFLRMRRDGTGNTALCGVEVELPAHVPTHCSKQAFYFDDTGCIRRHDYVADIIGWWARGAHYWRQYHTVGGMPIATERRVVPLILGVPLPVTALYAKLVNTSVGIGNAPLADTAVQPVVASRW